MVVVRDHVPGPLPVTEQDLGHAARFVLKAGLPVVARVLGFDGKTEERLRGVISQDAEYLGTWLHTSAPGRPVAEIEDYVAACGVKKSAFYAACAGLATAAERFCVAL